MRRFYLHMYTPRTDGVWCWVQMLHPPNVLKKYLSPEAYLGDVVN